jgi:hypothetical protein
VKLTDWFDYQTIRELRFLGRYPRWLRYEDYTLGDDPMPRTKFRIGFDHIPARDRIPSVENVIWRLMREGNYTSVSLMDSLGMMAAWGPKLFKPTNEQWEAMEQVEIGLPIRDYRQPYPVITIEIPDASRSRLAREYGLPLDGAPRYVIVRHRQGLDDADTISAYTGGPGSRGQEIHYLMQEKAQNPSIETALQRDATPTGEGRNNPLFRYGMVANRAAFNLCLLLTHYGCVLQPTRYPNRAEERNARNHGVFEAIKMVQNIVVRGPRVSVATGETHAGRTPDPHWVKGHWRAKAGYGARRALGETVPLTFVKPYLTGGDRVVGDLGDSLTTYNG